MSGTIGGGSSDALQATQNEAMQQFQEESIRSTLFQMQMQKLQTDSSDAHKAAGASTTS